MARTWRIIQVLKIVRQLPQSRVKSGRYNAGVFTLVAKNPTN